jgi:hypothetical protein
MQSRIISTKTVEGKQNGSGYTGQQNAAHYEIHKNELLPPTFTNK